MILNLPQWYRIAAVENVSEELLNRRSTAIDELLSSDSWFFFDCVRLYLGKKVRNSGFEETFFKAFNEKDPMYLSDTGALERRILAGAILAQCFAVSNDFGDEIAYALINGSFGIDDKDIINSDIIETARVYLCRRAIEERTSILTLKQPVIPKDDNLTAESLPAYVKAIGTYVKNLTAYSDKQIKNSQKRIDRLQEESNVHWWLFRSFSDVRSAPIGDLAPDQSAFIVAFELSKLITTVPAPENISSFINKSLNEIKELPLELSIAQITSILSEMVQVFGDALDGDAYGNLTPLMFAYHQFKDSNGDAAWTSIFRLNSQIDVTYSTSIQTVALQFFNELMLLNIHQNQ